MPRVLFASASSKGGFEIIRTVLDPGGPSPASDSILIGEIAEQAISGAEPDAIFAASVTALARYLSADLTALWELLPDGHGLLLLRAGFGWEPGQVGRATIPTGGGSYAGHALRTGAPVLVEQASAETWLRMPPLLQEHGIETALLVPILGRDAPVGALGIYLRQPADFSLGQARLLTRVARLLAAVVDRGRVTARLDASEGKLAAIFDSALDAILVADDRRVLIEANPAACRLYGRRREDIVGQTIEAFTPGADAVQAQIAWDAFLVEGEQSGIFRVLRPDGVTRIADYRARAHFLPGLHLSVLRDVSEEHSAQEALKEAGRSKDEFLAMLAHELRNPLAPVVNAIEILRQRGSDEAVRQRALEVMNRQTRNMARLIEDLLDASRITRGTIELRLERVDLVHMVERAVEESSAAIEARRHHLTVVLPPAPLWLVADPVRLEQVLTNLLNNAAKFTPPGGRIAVEVAAEAGEAVLRVRDDGEGIPPDLLPWIFDLFVQADRSLDRTHGGLGIGLTLVRNLVRFHGGSVTAQSDGLGLGSEFVVRLPQADPTPPQESAGADDERTAGPPASRTGLRVLVVEDNLDSAQSLGELLELWGHEARVVHDGPSALALAPGFGPAVVLLDIGLPSMDGYEVALALCRDASSPPPYLVALSGYGQEQDRERSREAGIDRHFTKPMDPQELRQLLAEIDRPGSRQAAHL